MIKLRRGSTPLLIVCFISFFASIFSTVAKAETYNTTGPDDFYFTFAEQQIFSVRTYAWQNQIDSMLWLYNYDNNLIAVNDDYYGLDSYINITLQPGTYRLRTGVCCGNPNAWYGSSYSFETTTGLVVNTTSTTSTSTTSTSTTSTSTTSTTSTSTTTTTTSTTSTTTTTVLPTTTTVPETTTTQIETTTTIPKIEPTTTLTPSLPQTTILPITTTTSTSTTTTTTSTTVPVSTTILTPETTTTTIPKIIEENISQEQALNVATSKDAIVELSKEDAVKVFDAIDASQITEEEKTQIIEAVQDAPKEIKQAFEAEIDIYGDGFDEYIPTGSAITVKARRTLLAALGAVSAITVGSGDSNGSPGGNSNSPKGGNDNTAFKKEEDEEEDEEEAPEIEGPEGGDDGGQFTKNSIFKYGEGGMKKFSIWNFIKKFSKETAALAFTISSTVIVFATLSGDTRKITLIATSCAFLVHYLSVMIKNDE